MRTELMTAPSHWAPYLINGDASDLSESEAVMVREWLENNELPEPVSCEDAGFCWQHDASDFYPACDCQLYTFLLAD